MSKSWDCLNVPGAMYGSDAGTMQTRPLVGRVVVDVAKVAEAVLFLAGKRCKILATAIQPDEASGAVCISYQLNRKLPMSDGHIRFAGEWEYFKRDDQQVYRAPINAPILTDGCRSGRWECAVDHWDRTGAALVASWAD